MAEKRGGAKPLPSTALAVPQERATPKSAKRKAGKTTHGGIDGVNLKKKAAANPDTGLTPQMEEFAKQRALGKTATDAYDIACPPSREAGRKRQTVYVAACRWDNNPLIQARVAELLRNSVTKNQADVDMVLSEYLQRLKADPRELTELWVSACRRCWGEGHRYQYTDGEYEDERAENHARNVAREEAGKPPIPFNPKGGPGYSRKLAPNQDCPSCGGAGEPKVVLKDTRHLSPQALALFRGAEQGKEGIKVNVDSRTDALMAVARHVGFFDADNTQEVVHKFDPAELDALYEKSYASMREKEVSSRARRERIDAGEFEDANVIDGEAREVGGEGDQEA